MEEIYKPGFPDENIPIFEDERVDNTGFGGLKLIQKPGEFCYGIDAVLLAEFASRTDLYQKGGGKKNRNSIIDLGAGTGIIPFILSHKTKAQKIYGLEIQEGSYSRFSRAVKLNGLEHRVVPIQGNVGDPHLWQGPLLGMKGSFDAVTVNPPYSPSEGGITSQTKEKALARHETFGELKDFICLASKLLRPGGDFYIIQRPSRLVDIFTLSREWGLEPKGLKMVAPREGAIPNIMLVHCIKQGNPYLRILPTLNVYDSQGNYTEEVKEIYEIIPF